MSAAAIAALQDDVSEYSVELPINELMEGGIWRLVSVQVGRARFKTIPVADKDANFEVQSDTAPINISLKGPSTVQAGTKSKFRVTVDRVPESVSDPNRCADALRVTFRPSNPLRTSAEEHQQVKLVRGLLNYEVEFERLPDAEPTGQWEAVVTAEKDYSRSQPCPPPRPLAGQERFAFRLLPPPDLVIPQSVEVTMNPTQVQLLRAEASALQQKAQRLAKILNSGYVEGGDKILRDSVSDALKRLSETESAYNRESGSSNPAATIFFGDIGRSYRDVLSTLTTKAAPPVSKSHLVFAAATTNQNVTRAGAAVLASFYHNIDAYLTVAAAERLTFDLKVRSDPQGAKISYRRTPDPFQPSSDVTNSVIPNLPVAVWFVRLQKDGYDDEERQYDATREKDPMFVKLFKRKPKPSR